MYIYSTYRHVRNSRRLASSYVFQAFADFSLRAILGVARRIERRTDLGGLLTRRRFVTFREKHGRKLKTIA